MKRQQQQQQNNEKLKVKLTELLFDFFYLIFYFCDEI